MARKNPLTAQRMVKTNCTLLGKCDAHEFPVVVADGSPFAAVEALSFEVQESKTLELGNALRAVGSEDCGRKMPKFTWPFSRLS